MYLRIVYKQTQIRMYYFILISYIDLIQDTIQERLGIETICLTPFHSILPGLRIYYGAVSRFLNWVNPFTTENDG